MTYHIPNKRNNIFSYDSASTLDFFFFGPHLVSFLCAWYFLFRFALLHLLMIRTLSAFVRRRRGTLGFHLSLTSNVSASLSFLRFSLISSASSNSSPFLDFRMYNFASAPWICLCSANNDARYWALSRPWSSRHLYFRRRATFNLPLWTLLWISLLGLFFLALPLRRW